MTHAKSTALVLVIALLVGMCPVTSLRAAEADAPKTYTVKPEELRVELSVSGVLESSRMSEISVVPEAWGQLKVTWAVEPGTTVDKGDVLLTLDTEDLDQRIKDIEVARPLAALALEQAKEDLRLLEITTPEDLAWARRSARIAREEFDFYMKRDVAFKEPYMKLDRESADIWLEGAKTELSELERMYEADDLVETTEELILRRQRHGLKRTELGYAQSKIANDYEEEVLVPRELEERKKTVRNAEISLDRAETMLDLALRRKRLEVAIAEHGQAKAALDLVNLKADRELMTVKAPAAGVVYYGQCVRGRWISAGNAAQRLKPNGQIGPHEVVMTIVEPDELFARADVAEKNLADLSEGLEVTVTPTGYPEHEFDGEIETVTIVPGGPAPYSITVSLDGDEGPVMAGMTCSLKMVLYEDDEALMVPAKAVFQETGDARYVYVSTPEGSAKTAVTVGREKGGKLEILEGLSEGDEILLEEPGE